MGYLDGSSVTVDAVLTKKGREILSDPSKGSLNITSFTCSDDGVDYTLWNPDHPSGSAYYGEAIENLPMLEASVHAEYSLRNRLLTLSQNAIALPALVMSGLDGKGKDTLTLKDGDTTGVDVRVSVTGYSSTSGVASTGGGIYFVILDPSIIRTNAKAQKHISGTTRIGLREEDLLNAVEYHVGGAGPDFHFKLIPDTEQKKTGYESLVYVVHIETGAFTSFRVINNVTKLERTVLDVPKG
tara:strand:+ start:2604 stop:3326 length:723 start_codon:yes stop_codon:yes gene_type:complete